MSVTISRVSSDSSLTQYLLPFCICTCFFKINIFKDQTSCILFRINFCASKELTDSCILERELKTHLFYNGTILTVVSSVATIFAPPPANILFGPLAKGLRRPPLPGGKLAGPFSLAVSPRSRGLRGLRGPRYTPLTVVHNFVEALLVGEGPL